MNSDSSFEQQFAHRVFLDTPFGRIETVDLQPSHQTERTPILLVPGWGGTLELQKACLKEIYSSGRRVISLRHAIRIKKQPDPTQYPIATLQKAETILWLLQLYKIKQVDVIAHSEGSLCSTVAATMRPDMFKNLVFVTPAGVSGKDNGIRIVAGFLSHNLISQLKDLRKARHLVGAIKRPKGAKEGGVVDRLASLRKEVSAIASFDIYPLFVELRRQGIKIAILAGEKDIVFPLRKMRSHLDKSFSKGLLEKAAHDQHYGINIFATKKDGHELHFNAAEVTDLALNLLNNLRTADERLDVSKPTITKNEP